MSMRGGKELTDKEMQSILDDIVIIVDTREQKNQHILDYLVGAKIPYIEEKLDTGDYSLILPNYPHLELDRKFLVEKKNSLDEIAGNFTKGRERFIREFNRAKESHQNLHLVIEQATFKKIYKKSYRSKFPAKSFKASLLTFCIRYKVPVWFVQPEESPDLIYSILYYELFEKLKEMRDMDGK